VQCALILSGDAFKAGNHIKLKIFQPEITEDLNIFRIFSLFLWRQ